MRAETFGKRLTTLLDQQDVSQSDLAVAVGVSRAAVSAWCRDEKKPSPARRAKIASRLGVEEQYLEFGIGEGTVRGLEAGRATYAAELGWFFEDEPKSRSRTMGNPAEFAFDVSIPVLVREAGQNSLDERIPTAQTVEMVFTVMELTGTKLTDFLGAIKFEQVLKPHLEAAAQYEQKASAILRGGLHLLEEQRSLILLRIEDYNAYGLTGPEYESGRYMAVVRNTLDSHKSGATAGGSYGLGKATLWACSQFGLVLMNSTLHEDEDDRWRGRFIGRLELPWHELGGQRLSGPGWVGGLDQEDVAISYWENDSLLHDTYLERSDERPGTSFLIVSAHDPAGEAVSPSQMAECISQAAAQNFWPAMVPRNGDEPARLAVTIRSLRNGELLSETKLDPAEWEPAKVNALRRYYDGATVESLEQAGDVVALTVPLTVEERISSRDPHPRASQDAIVLVAEADEEDHPVNTVAYMRGSLMIVRGATLRGLPLGARDFHAVVLAGEAAGDDETDRLADRFLRAAEPPEHNDWTGTSEISQSYARGAKQRLAEFKADVENEIRLTIARPLRELSDGPSALKELLRVGGRKPTAAAPRVKGGTGHPDPVTGAWSVRDVVVSLPDTGRPWELRPIVRFGTDSGAAQGIEWKSVEAIKNCIYDSSTGVLLVPAGKKTIKFNGETKASSQPVNGKYAKALVDVRVVKGGALR